MIYLIIGTKAQLIKMAPVMVALRDQGTPYRYISTGQHRDTTQDILDNFGLRGPDHVLYDGPDVTSIRQMVVWGTRILGSVLRQKEDIFGSKPEGIALVHGDTFSTLLGALMARVAGLHVGHVESGLRSFNLFHPFPEELTRLLTFRLTNVYFCPGAWAVDNLLRYKGERVNTHQNTLTDALHSAMQSINTADVPIPPHPYAIVSIHRFENIHSRKALERIITTVMEIAQHVPLLFILHKITEKKLRRFGLFDVLQQSPGVELRQRYDYFRFIKLLSNSEFVISDGGSNQEECHYLAKPILLLRNATERQEGIGTNCVLSRYDRDIIQDFISNYHRHALAPPVFDLSPSALIARSCRPFATP